MKKKEHLNAILNEVEAKFGRGDSAGWKNRDFEDLNFEINKNTKTIISALTLKRIFGKIKTTDDYLPQKATLKALEKYVDFVQKKQAPLSEIINVDYISNPHLETEKTYKQPKKKTRLLILITGILCILVSACYYLFSTQKITTQNAEWGQIRLMKSDGINPKTVFFEYSTPNNTDSFHINFDENYHPIYIPNGKNKKTTYFFQYPGLYKVRMQKKNKVFSDSILVYVPTKGWQALGYYFDQKYSERYFPINIENCTRNGNFHPTKKDLNNSGMDTAKITVIRFDNFHETGVSGDTFTLETTLKNPDKWSGIRCNSIYLYVEGRKGTIRFRFANPGCSYWIDYRLSEKEIINQNEDLSNFTFSLSDWKKFRIENQNKHVNLFINNISRFSNTYQKSIGEIIGITVLFHGNGYLEDYKLTDAHGSTVFKFKK
ncbi:MAG: hypothetical protein JZU53_14300 [Paludibacter sp.]|nr:hypothetical protein [Paludibacter sp.]